MNKIDSDLEWEEIPRPIGDFILAQKDLPYEQTSNGAYWHYVQVCEMLSRYGKMPVPKHAGRIWVKAKDRLPDKPGENNKVIVRGKNFVTYGFKNFDEERPEMYYTLGNESYLNNDVEWLDESETQELFTREGAYKMVMDMGRHFRNIVPTLALINDWFNINYPKK